MTTFTRTWDASYEAVPADSDNANEGAQRIRNGREDTRERLDVDHYMDGDTHDGKHSKVTLKAQASDPTLDSGDAAIYGKTVNSRLEIYAKGAMGNGAVVPLFPAGVLMPYAGGTIPNGWLACDGTAYDSVTNTQYAALYAAIANAWGGTDGTNFKVPDLRGRTLIGDGTGSGLTARTLGTQNIGAETHQLTEAEMPSHDHNVTKGNAGGSSASFFSYTGSTANQVTDGSGIADAGSDNAHNNMQPSAVVKWIISY